MPSSLENFIEMLKFPDPPHDKLNQTVKDLNQKELIPAMIDLLVSTSDPAIKRSVIQVLQYLAGVDSLRPLLEIVLESSNPKIQHMAIKALGLINHKEALPILEKIVNRSDNPELIQVASQSIQVIQGISPAYSIEDL